MFDHNCTACGKRQLIFPTQVASMTNTAERHRRRVHVLVRRGPDLGHRSPGHRRLAGAHRRLTSASPFPIRRGE